MAPGVTIVWCLGSSIHGGIAAAVVWVGENAKRGMVADIVTE